MSRQRAAPPHAPAHAARLAPAGRPRRDRAVGDGDGLGHGARAGGRPRRAVRRRRANASAVAGQPVEDRLVRVAQDAVVLAADRLGAALPGSRCSSSRGRRSGRVARDLHAALRRAGVAEGVMVAAGGVAADVDELGRSYEEAALDARARARAQRAATSSSSTRSSASTGCCRACRSTSCAATAPRRSARCSSTTATTTARSSTPSRSSCAASATASRRPTELFIHYNTLRYRLGQIDQLTGGLSGDSTARLNLELALCAHRLVLGREEA